jgi:hypothetical protein
LKNDSRSAFDGFIRKVWFDRQVIAQDIERFSLLKKSKSVTCDKCATKEQGEFDMIHSSGLEINKL